MNALAASFPVSNDPENTQVITTVATSLKVPVILNQDSRVQDKGNFMSILKIYTIHSLDYFEGVGTIFVARALSAGMVIWLPTPVVHNRHGCSVNKWVAIAM